ncbi:hypothetical protein CRYUN_Cryun08bG0054200 [Craigia yunnanensis]
MPESTLSQPFSLPALSQAAHSYAFICSGLKQNLHPSIRLQGSFFNGEGNVNRAQSSSTKTQSHASAGPVARSMHSSETEDSPLKSPNGDHRHVHFGVVVVLGSSKYNQNDNGGESPHEDVKGHPETEREGKENSHDSIASDKDYVSAACRKGEAPLIVSVST